MLNRIQSLFTFESRRSKLFVFSVFGAFLGLSWIFFASFQPTIDKFLPLYQTDLPLSLVRVSVAKPIQPLFPQSDPSEILNLQVFEGLTRVYKGAFMPGIAKSWQTDDNLTWRFILDEKATFSNGEKVKASDIKFSFEKALQEKWPNQEVIAKIKSVEIIDKNSIEIKTKKAETILPKDLAYFYIISEKAYLQNRQIIAAGPYKVDSIENQKAKLSINTFYTHQTPKVKEVEFLVFADEKNRADAIIAGLFDIARFETSSEVDRLSKAGLQIKPFNLPQITYLGINFGNSQLKNKEIRQAVAQAINPAKIIVDSGIDAAVSASILAPELFGFDPTISALPFTPEKSRQLLTGKNLNFFMQAFNLPDLVSRSIAAQLSEVGIRTDVANLQKQNQATAAIFAFSFSPKTLDGQEILEKLLATKKETFGTNNFGNYSNQIIDQLVNELATTKTDTERFEILTRALRIANDDIAYIPLYSPKVYLVTNDKVFGQFFANGEIRIAELSGRGFVFKKK